MTVWPGGVLVRALNLRLRRSRVRVPAVPLISGIGLTTLRKLFAHMCLCRQEVIFGRPAGQVAVKPCGWEGNRRSSVALSMRETSSTYQPTGSRPKHRK